MITKKTLILLAVAVLAVTGAVFSLLWSKKVNQEIENPTFFLDAEETSMTWEDAVQFLMSDFEGLLSGDDVASLYEGEEGTFTTGEAIDE